MVRSPALTIEHLFVLTLDVEARQMLSCKAQRANMVAGEQNLGGTAFCSTHPIARGAPKGLS